MPRSPGVRVPWRAKDGGPTLPPFRRLRRAAGSLAPSPLLLASEPPRAGLDLAALLAASPFLATAPRGDGHPVLVIPGLLTGDPATVLLRNTLRALGHNVSGWSLGLNRGPTGQVVSELRATLERLHSESGQKVTLVGWSLGGLYAQELARATPGSVRRLVTLGAPVLRRSGWMKDASRLVDRATHLSPLAAQLPRPWVEHGPLRVPATSVYTRADGVVHWRVCRFRPGPRRESIEVRGSHFGLAHNPAVLWVVADRLAQPEDSWTPFQAPLALRPLFPRRRQRR